MFLGMGETEIKTLPFPWKNHSEELEVDQS